MVISLTRQIIGPRMVGERESVTRSLKQQWNVHMVMYRRQIVILSWNAKAQSKFESQIWELSLKAMGLYVITQEIRKYPF